MGQIIELITKVMNDAGAVRKQDFNTHQKFNFRGIDAIINAVSPALRKHGVIIFPEVLNAEYESVQVGQNRTPMGCARLLVKYTFAAPDGSIIETVVAAESMDSGDKATPKAMSVAFRTALIQTLCLPTDETDPDADTFVRSPESSAPSEQPKQTTMRTTRPASDGQKKLVRDLLTQTQCAEQLIIDEFGTTVEDMTNQNVQKIIKAMYAIKNNQAEITLRDDGSYHIVLQSSD